MPAKESGYPADWLAKAQKDWDRVEPRLRDDDVEDAAFHLQQAVEKYLKGYLLSKGWKLERTHDLEKLLDTAVEYDPSFESFRSLCQEITGYYVGERYPFLAMGITRQEIEAAMPQANLLIQKIISEAT